ncbi:MAG: hypothetical protein LEGION0403_FIIPPAGN_02654 [Legionella sp.]|uniref:DUF1328 domain-containing protein n=1 Tax=Legionella sp. TaxID=459 RepID=UPI003D0B7ADD
MLAGAFIFLAVSLLLAIYVYKGFNPTLILLAKALFYFSLAMFFILLIADFFNHIPPISEDKKNLSL